MLVTGRGRSGVGAACAAMAVALAGCASDPTPGTGAGAGTEGPPAGGSSVAEGPPAADDGGIGGATGTADEPRSEPSGGTGGALDDPAVADAVFLTAVDEVVVGTSLAGVVDADPGGFLLLATTVCDLLDEDVDAGELLDAALGVLGATEGDGDPDTAMLAGGVVGAAVEVYCPRHAAGVASIEGRR